MFKSCFCCIVASSKIFKTSRKFTGVAYNKQHQISKMLTQKDFLEAQLQFEKTSHKEIYDWTKKRAACGEIANLEICDLSVDGATFSQLLAQKLNAKRLLVIRSQKTTDLVPALPEDSGVSVETVDLDVFGKDKSFDSIKDLGQFDLIILKEMMFDIEDLQGFLTALKVCLKKPTESKIFAFARPKNPPVPLPDPAMAVWRKMTPSREEIIVAAEAAGYKQDFYAASCPIRVEKSEWSKILHSRCLAAVKNSPKCTDKEIRDFISTRPKMMVFEEKIFIIVLWLEGEGPVDDTPIGTMKDLQPKH